MMKFISCLLFWLALQSLVGVKFWFILYFIVLFYGVYLFMGVPLFLGFSMGASEIGWDIMSFSLMVLSVWLMVVVFCSSFSINKDHSLDWYYGILVFFLMLMLIFSFSSLNFLGFYLFFEGSLIPTFLIIMGWGYQPERLQASIYFLFYTVTSSLPLLLGLVSLYVKSGFLLNYLSWGASAVSSNLLSWGFGFMMISAFLVKMPMFMVHLWLPKAHVEAPVAGSMVLAGVLLKLGGYGLMRVFDKFPKFVWLLSSWFISLGLLGMAYVGLMCCRLNDMKALVAYSSVAHMGLVIIGCFIMSVWGFDGALMMMLGHGLASSGLFMCLNLFYDRSSSRSFFINSGLMVLFPIFSLFFFLLCASNIAAPPTLNLLSEMYLMGGILGYDKLMLLIFPLGSFLGAVFSVYLFSNSQHGNLGFSKSGFWGAYWVELHGLSLHIIPLNIMVLKFELLTVWV